MKTRVLKINLAPHLRNRLKEHPKSTLADEIGVTPQKLNSMLNDEWNYITRDAIERTADYMELSAADVFEFVPVDFWSPIEQTKKCTFLRGTQDVSADEKEFTIPLYDDEATEVIKRFFRKSLKDFNKAIVADPRQDQNELLRRARRENCIVIGSPKSNAASEVLLSKFFGATPFDSSLENRRKIPFGFCWPDNAPRVARSSLTCSALARQESQNQPGIALKDGIHIVADYDPRDEFLLRQTKSGKDCGLVFVANKPFRTKHNVKLIVIAGFSGIGTLAAAKALVQDFRYLEQVGDEHCVYGVVEGRYSKSAQTNARRFKGFSWRYREGGRWPIRPEKNENANF